LGRVEPGRRQRDMDAPGQLSAGRSNEPSGYARAQGNAGEGESGAASYANPILAGHSGAGVSKRRVHSLLHVASLWGRSLIGSLGPTRLGVIHPGETSNRKIHSFSGEFRTGSLSTPISGTAARAEPFATR